MVLSPNVIQAIPKMGVEERHILRKRATAWLKSGSKEQAAGAKAALEARMAKARRGELGKPVPMGYTPTHSRSGKKGLLLGAFRIRLSP